jgi:hypothetical protein
MVAVDDKELYKIVRKHTDDQHPEKRYTNNFLREYIEKSARDTS